MSGKKMAVKSYLDGQGVPVVMFREPDSLQVVRVSESAIFSIHGGGKGPEEFPLPAYAATRTYSLVVRQGDEVTVVAENMLRNEADALLKRVDAGIRRARWMRTGYRAAALLGAILVGLSFAGRPDPGLPLQAAEAATMSAQPAAVSMSSRAPIENAIRLGAENAPMEKTLFVFTDPLCPFCRDFDPVVASLPKDYRVYVFPVAFKEGSEALVNAVYCGQDRATAWHEAINGTMAPTINCGSTAAQDNTRLFTSMGLSATPTVVNGFGKVHAGSMDRDAMVAFAAEK